MVAIDLCKLVSISSEMNQDMIDVMMILNEFICCILEIEIQSRTNYIPNVYFKQIWYMDW